MLLIAHFLQRAQEMGHLAVSSSVPNLDNYPSAEFGVSRFPFLVPKTTNVQK